jgi:hypothetical protein
VAEETKIQKGTNRETERYITSKRKPRGRTSQDIIPAGEEESNS